MGSSLLGVDCMSRCLSPLVSIWSKRYTYIAPLETNKKSLQLQDTEKMFNLFFQEEWKPESQQAKTEQSKVRRNKLGVCKHKQSISFKFMDNKISTQVLLTAIIDLAHASNFRPSGPNVFTGCSRTRYFDRTRLAYSKWLGKFELFSSALF